MLALTPMQRRFAMAAVLYPLAKDWQIAKAAGYSDKSNGFLRLCAHRCFHDERILAAIKECADKEARGSGMLGLATMKRIARLDGHKDQFKAAMTLAGLAGLTVAQNINVNQTVKDESSGALMKRIEAAAAILGVDPAVLLGMQPMKVIQHEEPAGGAES